MRTATSSVIGEASHPAAGPRNAIASALGAGNRFSLCLVLTCLLLILYGHREWYINIPLTLIALAALIFTSVRQARWTWIAAAVILIAGTLLNWYSLDNHKYLLCYWTIAIFCSLCTRDPEQTLAQSARTLIALVFLLAVVQKAISPDYLDGTMMYYELLTDPRFAGIAQHVGAMPDHLMQLNEAARSALINYDSNVHAVTLRATPLIMPIAMALTWWNFAIQIVIGVAFALAPSTWLHRTRDLWLLVFLFTTYLFAPVIGFGWVLAIMGIAQTGEREHRVRFAYLAAFLFLHVYRVPWRELQSILTGSA
jgi:hypothetical protein